MNSNNFNEHINIRLQLYIMSTIESFMMQLILNSFQFGSAKIY